MSEYPQSGLHPDPDTLNAFVEGVLPEHERLACLAHFADCATCREVVYLTQEPEAPPPDLPVERTAWWKHVRKPAWALSAVAVTGIVALSIALYRMEKPVPITPLAMSARSASQMADERAAAPPSLREKTREGTRRVPNVAASRPTLKITPHAAPAPIPHGNNPQPVSSPTWLRMAIPAPVAPRTVPQASLLDAVPNDGSINTQSGVTGTITDPTGAVIAGAAVTARSASGAPATNTVTDKSGQFFIAGLRPGSYELQVTQSGFQSARKEIEIQPGQIARADSSLSVGSAAESVTVAATSGAINSELSSPAKTTFREAMPSLSRMAAVKRAATVNLNSVSLPNKLAAVAIATKAGVTLAADSAGALYRSDNAGAKWELVKAVWQGKVVELAAESATFRLKTDTGAAWLSRDGKQWFSAPAQPQ
jgi:hypothetical protein